MISQVCSAFSKDPTVAGGKQRNVMAFEGSVRIKIESVQEHEGSPAHKHAQILAELERKSQPDLSSSGVSSSGVSSSGGGTGTLDGCNASGEPYIYRKGNKKYTHHRFVTEVLEIIAAEMLDDIKGLLAAAPVVGLMVDESVDVSGK